MFMTIEQYEEAKQLQDRIEHLNELFSELNSCKFGFDPPTRFSGFTLKHVGAVNDLFVLSEEDVDCIRKAFKEHINKLQKQFKEL